MRNDEEIWERLRTTDSKAYAIDSSTRFSALD